MTEQTNTTAQPRVAIVVVHFGRPEDTDQCLASLARLACPAYGVLVVDNGSPAGALGDLTRKHGTATFLRLEQNAGYAGGANRGFDWARERGAAFALLLNNDTVIEEPDTLDRLLACAQRERATVVTPRVLNESRGRRQAAVREYFFPNLALTFHAGAWPARLLAGRCRTVPFVSGAAMLVDLAAAPTPFFDPAYFAYFEDLDVCMRLGAAAIAACEAAALVHKVSRSTGAGLTKHYYKARNLLYLARKHGLYGPRFRAAYRLLFLPMQARAYWRTPGRFLRTTRRAVRDGLAMPVAASSRTCQGNGPHSSEPKNSNR
ncbi:MAG: glycosyltransferase family 2 protein [Kiritimatiellae bacterium]|nr:glycosyltransferase family 2 protein [Kiritimatiellia bacterium]